MVLCVCRGVCLLRMPCAYHSCDVEDGASRQSGVDVHDPRRRSFGDPLITLHSVRHLSDLISSNLIY